MLFSLLRFLALFTISLIRAPPAADANRETTHRASFALFASIELICAQIGLIVLYATLNSTAIFVFASQMCIWYYWHCAAVVVVIVVVVVAGSHAMRFVVFGCPLFLAFLEIPSLMKKDVVHERYIKEHIAMNSISEIEANRLLKTTWLNPTNYKLYNIRNMYDWFCGHIYTTQ